MEAVYRFESDAQSSLFSSNHPTILWVDGQVASKSSVVARQLVCALALRIKKATVSPITPLHIQRSEYRLADVPS